MLLSGAPFFKFAATGPPTGRMQFDLNQVAKPSSSEENEEEPERSRGEEKETADEQSSPRQGEEDGAEERPEGEDRDQEDGDQHEKAPQDRQASGEDATRRSQSEGQGEEDDDANESKDSNIAHALAEEAGQIPRCCTSSKFAVTYKHQQLAAGP